MRMGPPPPGYIKITGEPVPDWTPAAMLEPNPNIWTPLGPRPIVDEYWSGSDDASGRVVSLAPHPTDPNTVYAAAASGGIWKTIDGGVNWTPLTDELSILNHGCVALDPSNPETVYVGTGEYSMRSTGDGLFRSTDGGATWERLATTSQVGVTCSRILVDPSDSLTLHVAGDPGYARSTDGGATWTMPFVTFRGVSDLAMKAGTPDTLWLGEHGVGLWRSTNGGATWSPLAGGLPTTGVNRIVLAAAPSAPNVVYTAIIDGSAGLRGVYRSDDGGDTWVVKPNTPNFPSPQGWYDVFLGVDPRDENVVYGGGVFPTYAVAGIIRTTDGGNSWVDISCSVPGNPGSCLSSPNVHPDMHAIAFDADFDMWVGCDGGVWKRPDGTDDWINTSSTLVVTQNYEIAVNPLNPIQVLGGTQDNGTVERQQDIEGWPQVLGGDGGYLAYDFDDPNRRYTTYVYLSVYRLVGGSVANITGPWSGDRKNFIAPLVMDPNDSDTLLGGTYRIWRTNNASTAATWGTISGDLTVGGRLNAIAVAVGNSEFIYSGSTDGKVFVKPGAGFFLDRSTGLPGGEVSEIVISPVDPDVGWVGFYNTSGPRVLATENAGASWMNVTGDLPAGVAARALAIDFQSSPPALLLGSGAGVWWSIDGGTSWTKDATDLPNVNVGDLVVDSDNGTVFVGTYGRGTWRASLADLVGGTEALYCFSVESLCDGIEVLDVLPDKTVVGTWKNFDCAGSDAPMLGGYSGKDVSPRLSWMAADPFASLEAVSFNVNVDTRTFDLWVHDTSFNLTQIQDDQPYTVTPGACVFGPERDGLPASMGMDP